MKRSTKTTGLISNGWLKIQLIVIALFSTGAVLAEVAQSPLFLTASVKPNIMLMVDNSISMGNSLDIVGSGTNYDANLTYLSSANCDIHPLADTISITNLSTCQSAGGTNWSNNRCTISGMTSTTCQSPGVWVSNRCVISSPARLIYSTTVPSGFFGNGSGTKCFASATTYTLSSSLEALVPSDITTLAQHANWLNWYFSNQLQIQAGTISTTRLAVVKAAANALIDYLDSDVRVGLSMFNSGSGGTLYEVIDDLVATKKTNIKNRINAIGGGISLTSTPLAGTMAGIGRYYATGASGNLTLHPGLSNQSTAGAASVFPTALTDGTGWSGRTAIAGEPAFATAPIQYSCQKSFNVVITDGLPSSDRSISTNTNLQDYDGDCSGTHAADCGVKSGSSWSTTHYDMKKIYNYPGTCNTSLVACVNGAGSNSSDYFDDVTQALYEIDLRPDLTKTGGAKNNVTTYVVGLADDAINPTIPGVNPLPSDAARQGGGKFYFAGSEAELTSSLISTINFITEQSASSSSVATNSTQYQTDTLIYQAVFNSKDWSGDLRAYQILTEDVDHDGILDQGEDLNGNGKIDAGAIGSVLWNAADLIPTVGTLNAADKRRIYTYDPLSTGTKGIAFEWGALNAGQKAALGGATSGEDALNYLRGIQTKEIGQTGGTYRKRSSILGDIINSDPLYVGHINYGYATLPEGVSTYASFVATPRRAMIYVAANDGMLHGFDASTTVGIGGQEQFAYLPNAAITSSLVELTNPAYAHKYSVDASPQAGDVYFNGAWHTVLVGGLGAGGNSLFALDVTDPDSFSEANVLWEFTDTDLGYTLPQANIVRTNNAANPWVAVVANGYASTSGKAALYILNIQTGALVKEIVADATAGNGLSSSTAVDIDDDKIVDYIYAGDLKGNMWKFDISSSNIADWGVAYNGTPLFVATDASTVRQVITSKPAVSKATGTGQTSGTMVYFGTGKYFEVGDNVVDVNPQIDSFYAVWDVCDKSSVAPCSGVVSGRSLLQQQSIFYEGGSGIAAGGDVRVVTNCVVAYDATAPTAAASPCTVNVNRRGWYLDLVRPLVSGGAQGERAVSAPILRNGVVIFPTLIPFTTTCTPGGTSWLMELDQFSGARLSSGTPIDLNNDGVVNDSDLIDINGVKYAASGFASTVGIIDTPAIINCENGLDCKYASGSSGVLMMFKEVAPSTPTPTPLPSPLPVAAPGHRSSWQQLH